MIVTENIKLTNKELFKVMINSYLKKKWWLIAWIWVMIAILLFRQSNDSFGYYIVAALILLQVVMLYQYWGYANSKEHSQFVNDRHYEIESDRIVGINTDGTSTSIETRRFISVQINSKYYLLFTSRVEFIYIPVCSFKSTEDRKWFESEILSKIKT